MKDNLLEIKNQLTKIKEEFDLDNSLLVKKEAELLNLKRQLGKKSLLLYDYKTKIMQVNSNLLLCQTKLKDNTKEIDRSIWRFMIALGGSIVAVIANALALSSSVVLGLIIAFGYFSCMKFVKNVIRLKREQEQIAMEIEEYNKLKDIVYSDKFQNDYQKAETEFDVTKEKTANLAKTTNDIRQNLKHLKDKEKNLEEIAITTLLKTDINKNHPKVKIKVPARRKKYDK